MVRPVSRVCRVVSASFCLLFSGHLLWGSPTGLNNIPTTDVVPERTLVVQTWLNLAENKHPQQFIGFKYGVLSGLEFGVDWKANDSTHGHAELQAKYGFDIVKDLWRGVVGIANVTCNRNHNGEIFPYAGTSLDLKIFRVHFGYAPQPHNEAFFAGIDRTFPFLERNLQLRADAIHINDKNDMLLSVGFLYELGRLKDAETPEPSGLMGILDRIAKNIIIEGWVSMPSTGEQEVFTLKLNYVFKF
jgi:hypothetical protein